jgi:hypothetical protein
MSGLSQTFLDYTQMTGSLKDVIGGNAEFLQSFLKVISIISSLDVFGIGCPTSLSFEAILVIQVLTFPVLVLGLLTFLVLEWITARMLSRITLFTERMVCRRQTLDVFVDSNGTHLVHWQDQILTVVWCEEPCPAGQALQLQTVKEKVGGGVQIGDGFAFENLAAQDLSLGAYCAAQQYNKSLPRGTMLIFSVACMAIARASFSVFVCVEIEGRSVLLQDTTLQCDVDSDLKYARLQAWAIFGILQVTLLPLLILMYLYISHVRKGGWSQQTQERYVLFLCDAYVPVAWWFYPFRVIKKICFTLITQLPMQVNVRLLWAHLLLIGSLVVVTFTMPFISTTANRLEIGAQVLLTVCVSIASAHFVGGHTTSSEVMLFWQITVIILLVMAFVLYLFFLAKYSLRGVCWDSDDSNGKEKGMEMTETPLSMNPLSNKRPNNISRSASLACASVDVEDLHMRYAAKRSSAAPSVKSFETAATELDVEDLHKLAARRSSEIEA